MLKKITLLIISIIILLIIFFPTGLILDKKTNDIEQLLSKSLSSKKMSLLSASTKRIVYNEINGKKINYELLNVKFLSAEYLLNNKITNFYSASIKIKNNNAKVLISNYRLGIMYSFNYKKENNKWIERSSDWGRVKFEPSKPFYIYLENMRLTNPNYKNYNIKLIPRDSLK